jgi:ubiquinone biosynthesis protein UbiJ
LALARLVKLLPEDLRQNIAEPLAQIVAQALRTTAEACAGNGTQDLAALRELAKPTLTGESSDSFPPEAARWFAPVAALLAQDLATLEQLRKARSAPS